MNDPIGLIRGMEVNAKQTAEKSIKTPTGMNVWRLRYLRSSLTSAWVGESPEVERAGGGIAMKAGEM